MKNDNEKFIKEAAPATLGGVFFVILFFGLFSIEGTFFRWIGFDPLERIFITYNTLLMGRDTFQLGFISVIIINLIIVWGIIKMIFRERVKPCYSKNMDEQITKRRLLKLKMAYNRFLKNRLDETMIKRGWKRDPMEITGEEIEENEEAIHQGIRKGCEKVMEYRKTRDNAKK